MSAVALAHCPLCAVPLREESSSAPCPGCGASLRVRIFEEDQSRHPAKQEVIDAAGEGDARCRFLPDLKAQSVCDACGALMSEQAAVHWEEQSYCLPCVHRLREEGDEGGQLLGERMIYDNLALLLVTLLLPLSLLTAPVALYLLIRYRRAPRGLVPRGASRWWLALAASLISLVVWLGLLVLGVWLMVESLTK